MTEKHNLDIYICVTKHSAAPSLFAERMQRVAGLTSCSLSSRDPQQPFRLYFLLLSPRNAGRQRPYDVIATVNQWQLLTTRALSSSLQGTVVTRLDPARGARFTLGVSVISFTVRRSGTDKVTDLFTYTRWHIGGLHTSCSHSTTAAVAATQQSASQLRQGD